MSGRHQRPTPRRVSMFPTVDPIYGDANQEEGGELNGCDFGTFCCPGRTAWWRNLTIAIIFVCCILGLVGFIVSWVSFSRSVDATSQVVYPVSKAMHKAPLNHVMTGAQPITLTLPNDLSPYVGNHYTIDCESGAAHEVVITPGPLPTFWSATPGVRTATCTGGAGARSGFSFRVVSKSHVRVTQNDNVAFSA